ncbi:aminoacyl-tRNA hydrolase [Verrucomicrobia bacterium LW23]|nr:aminoacyl-tRNA hydrolase [Verrucomicrobia bacterium LW23]
MATTCRILVGLGNPGATYERTRHNVGFEVLDLWAARHGATPWRQEKLGPALVAKVHGDGLGPGGESAPVLLLKPTTYMNLSGKAVRAWMDFMKVPLASVLVVVDDVALELGTVRLRANGSSGGHNGLRSIEAETASAGGAHGANGGRGGQGYPRLRCGVGPLPPGWPLERFVLGRFTPTEKDTYETLLTTSADAIDTLLKEGMERAMNKVNAKQKPAAA